MNVELIAQIRNKLQAPKTALEMFLKGKDVPKNFTEKALEDLDEGLRLLNDLK